MPYIDTSSTPAFDFNEIGFDDEPKDLMTMFIEDMEEEAERELEDSKEQEFQDWLCTFA